MHRKSIALSVILVSVISILGAAPGKRDRSDIERAMEETFKKSKASEFSFCIENRDGRRYVFSKGGSTLDTAYESASTSKLVTAVILLRQIDKGRLSLDAKPSDLIPRWPTERSDPLSRITLAQLLSFTSGLEREPLSLNVKRVPFDTVVLAIARENSGGELEPGKRFYYSGAHLQAAGSMAIHAGGFSDWQAVFDEFRSETGLFGASAYDLPSELNPRLAGGMHWTAGDYMAFLRKLTSGELLSKKMMDELLRVRTAGPGVSIAYSPVKEAMGEDWQYGFGLWIESSDAAGKATRVSCPGAFGAYPFWDLATGCFGIVARQAELGKFPEGISIERSVRSLVMEWLKAE